MKLPKAAYDWALKHLMTEGDTDLFPRPFELDAIKHNWSDIVKLLESQEVQEYEWHVGRRFIVPKDNLAFRTATQLDPVDSILLAALMYKFGKKIEKRRISISEKTVFSYRFCPTKDGRLYGDNSGWKDFWNTSISKAKASTTNFVLVTDISDFYNQIYHHVLENQLAECLPVQVASSLRRFLTTLTHTVSRGIPVGPHSVHLLAEAALIPIDESLRSTGHDFCRYVDDIHIFAGTREEAQIRLYDLVHILDEQQRLVLQKHKTKIVSAQEFILTAEAQLSDRPINKEEDALLKAISKRSNNSPYQRVSLESFTPDEKNLLTQDVLEDLLRMYLSPSEPNFVRIGWLLRRLAQVGAPGAIDFVLNHIDQMIPVTGEIARYILSSSPNYKGNFKDAGAKLIRAIERPLALHSEYLLAILIDLFAKVPSMNHISSITKLYPSSTPLIRREIILAAAAAKSNSWLRGKKSDFSNGDPWLRRAILYASSQFPGDEADHWIKAVKPTFTGPEKLVVRWRMGKSQKLGDLKLK